ncbi:MAG: SAM-dependent methyltransferase [Ancalomicrobiaceae bacterium]|nr:SAM-dependent methyltransferase [Ancalomicrobiaceae bacterium]
MSDATILRPGERTAPAVVADDARLIFIGRIRTPWVEVADCPRMGQADGPQCRIEIDAVWAPALEGIAVGSRIEIFYWFDRSRRDLVVQAPRHAPTLRGTFSLRSPHRPNPIGVSIVSVEAVEGTTLVVRGLDCIDGTALIDIKPHVCDFAPGAGELSADGDHDAA